jgi:hypothetical protein
MARRWSRVIWTDGEDSEEGPSSSCFRYSRLQAHPNNEEPSSAKNPGINAYVDAHATFKPYLRPRAESKT